MAGAPAHQRRKPRSSAARSRAPWVVVGTLVLAGIVVGTVFYLRTSSPSANTPAAAPTPLTVLTTSPVGGTTEADPASVILVDFSSPLADNSPEPELTPPVPGAWAAASPSELEYVTSGPLVPGAHETLTVPGGHDGVFSTDGQHLAHSVVSSFTVHTGSTMRLQQLLAELGYLPLSFTPTATATSPNQLADPVTGTFTWRWNDMPAPLTALWTPGTNNVITKGAVMEFESQHNLTTDGLAGPQVWTDLLAAASTGATDPVPYDNVYVQKSAPETVYVYVNGTKSYQTLANTGVAPVPTPDGTFPVFLRYKSTTMKGTNPDGTKYVDPGIPWVSYFTGGDALHGYVRAQYGFPQSDGCVEMPPANAALVYPLTPIGTLVTVQ